MKLIDKKGSRRRVAEWKRQALLDVLYCAGVLIKHAHAGQVHLNVRRIRKLVETWNLPTAKLCNSDTRCIRARISEFLALLRDVGLVTVTTRARKNILYMVRKGTLLWELAQGILLQAECVEEQARH